MKTPHKGIWGLRWIPHSLHGDAVLTWSRDHTVRIWDAKTGEQRLKLMHDGGVKEAAWIAGISDSPLILSWSDDQTIRLWDAISGSECTRLYAGSDLEPIKGVQWLNTPPIGLIVTSWRDDGPIVVWYPLTANQPLQVTHGALRGARLVAKAFGTPAVLSWAAFDTARWWDPLSGQERGHLRDNVWFYNPEWIEDVPGGPAILGHSKQHIRLWDAASGEERARMAHDRDGVSVWWVPDACGEPGFLSVSYDKTIRLWDVDGVERLRLFDDESQSDACWIPETPTGPAVLTWSIIDYHVTLWDVTTARTRMRVRHDEHVRGALWIADPSRPAILTQSHDRTIRLWDAMSGESIARFDLDAEVWSFGVKAPSRRELAFAVGCHDGSMGVFDFLDCHLPG